MMSPNLPRNPTLQTAQASNFEGLWGSDTVWKSGVPRSRRLEVHHSSPDETVSTSAEGLQTHLRPALKSDAANTASGAKPKSAKASLANDTGSIRARLRPPADLSKPLPPLPGQTQVVDEDDLLPDGTLRRRSTVSRSLMSYTTMSSVYHGAKRIATFGLASKKYKARAVPGRFPSMSEGDGRSNGSTQPPTARAVETIQPPESQFSYQSTAIPIVNPTMYRPQYVDQGTQATAPKLTTLPESTLGLKQFVFRPSSRRFPSSESSHRSPRNIPKPGATSDYFHFQAEDVGGQAASAAQRWRIRENSSSRPQGSKSSSSESPSIDQQSTTSIGTYESKYSPPAQDLRSTSPGGRPTHTRSASDSNLTVGRPSTLGPTANPEKGASSSRPDASRNQRASADEGRQRSLVRNPTFRSLGQHPRVGPRSDNNNSSPLRQEMIVHKEEAESLPATPDPADMFRVPVGHVNPAEEPSFTVANVPEHLAGSPLCPLHPKHKTYPMGICPYHGRLSLTNSDDSHDSPKKDDVSEDKKSTNIDDEAFRLIMPLRVHSLGSAECPANPQNALSGNGVCVYHGRSRQADDYKKQPSRHMVGDFMWT